MLLKAKRTENKGCFVMEVYYLLAKIAEHDLAFYHWQQGYVPYGRAKG